MNNATSIINNMTIKMRADGRYEGRITINDRRKSFYGKTKTEIKQKARNYIQDVNNGYREPQRIKFNDYIEYWLKTYKWNKIEPSSYTRLYRVYECQIKDTIGRKYIGDITTKDIQELIDQHANPTKTDINPLSYSGLKRIVHLINPCLNQAVQEKIIFSNPCENIILPKESCMAVETKKQYSLSDNEIEELKNACLEKYKIGDYKSRDAFIILMILNLGLRAGEALALEWDDIDFENQVIHINKTIQANIKNFNQKEGLIPRSLLRNKLGEAGANTSQLAARKFISELSKKTYNRIKKSAKTYAGIRTLKLSPITLGYIRELQDYDKRKGIKSDYVACTSVGTINTEKNLGRSLKRIVERTNIQSNVALHTLRHTFGSTLVRRGVNIEVVSRLMGHSKISTTYNKYIHNADLLPQPK